MQVVKWYGRISIVKDMETLLLCQTWLAYNLGIDIYCIFLHYKICDWWNHFRSSAQVIQVLRQVGFIFYESILPVLFFHSYKNSLFIRTISIIFKLVISRLDDNWKTLELSYGYFCENFNTLKSLVLEINLNKQEVKTQVVVNIHLHQLNIRGP